MAEPEPKVRISGVGENGITYKARYYIDPVITSPSKARHSVIASVMEHVGRAGLTLAYPKNDVFVARMPWRQQTWTSPKDQVRQLGKLSLFSALKPEDMSFLVSRMRVDSYKSNAVVVEQGTEGDSMFILAEGLLEVWVANEAGTRVKVAELAPGTFFRREVAPDRRAALRHGNLRYRRRRLRNHQGGDYRTVRARFGCRGAPEPGGRYPRGAESRYLG